MARRSARSSVPAGSFARMARAASWIAVSASSPVASSSTASSPGAPVPMIASPKTAPKPADIDGKLHTLRAGQQHAVIESMQETLLAEPALLLDADAMHQRYLPGRATEAQQADTSPDPCRFCERGVMADLHRMLSVAESSRLACQSIDLRRPGSRRSVILLVCIIARDCESVLSQPNVGGRISFKTGLWDAVLQAWLLSAHCKPINHQERKIMQPSQGESLPPSCESVEAQKKNYRIWLLN